MSCLSSIWVARPRLVRAVWTSVLTLGSFSAHADEIHFAGQRMLDVQVAGLSDGKVEYRLSDGKSLFIWIDEVQRFVIAKGGVFVDFNLAEQFLHDGEPLKAIPRYERTNNLAPDFWGDLIHARLAMAHDRAGHIDRSTYYFLRVARGQHGGVGAAARVYPRSIPGRRDGPVARALEVLGDAIGRSDQGPRTLFSVLRYEILRRTDPQAAKSQAASISSLIVPEGARTHHVYEVLLQAMRDLAAEAGGKLKRERLEAAIRDCPDSMLPGFLLLKGEILAETAEGRDELIQAAWTLLRVPIHFPNCEEAPVALHVAAKVLFRLNMRQQGEGLLSECVKHPKVTSELREAIDRAGREH